MPKADFRLGDDALDPLAPVKVLAVMCYPTNPRGREGILRAVPHRIVIPRGHGPGELASDLWLRELWDELQAHRRPGGLAGTVALALTQLRTLNRRAEPGLVLSLASSIAQQWEQKLAVDAPGMAEAPVSWRNEAETLAAFQAYRSVAHLWAALVYGTLRDQPDIEPYATQSLPTFLAFAEEIARLAAGVTWELGAPGDGAAPGLAVDPEALWRFTLPADLRKTARAQMAPAAEVERPTVQAAPPPDVPRPAGYPTETA